MGVFAGGWSTYYLSVNRNKKSVAIDLKSEEGKRLLEDLIASADVLVENFRPGTLERLGFGPERARSMNERLIYCSISGTARPVHAAIFPATTWSSRASRA